MKGSKHAISIFVAFIAGIILTIGTGLIIGNHIANDYSIVTSKGQHAKAVLPDGTVVWINANTRLTYNSSFWDKESRITLNGEAYFDVNSRKNKLLCINTGKVVTRARKSIFNIRGRKSEETVLITPIQGSVEVYTPAIQGKKMTVKKGQTLRSRGSNYQTELFEYKHPEDVRLWISGKMNFDHYTLRRTLYILEKIYNVTFIYEDEISPETIVNGLFSTQDSLTYILDTLSSNKSFRYKKIDNIVYIMKH